MTWHIVTGEYPPSCGGVGDYVAVLAQALADAGDEVHVWCPGATESGESFAHHVHALPDRFGPGSRDVLQRALNASPGTLLLQYVPNALGARGANVSFCRWLRSLGGRTDLRVMFHEPYFYFGFARPWRNALAIAQRWMARALLQGSRTVYASTASWSRYLRAVGPLEAMTVLPIPSTIPRADSPDASREWRARMGGGTAPVVGHFGSYGTDVGAELLTAVPVLARRFPHLRFALIGVGGGTFAERLAAVHASTTGRTWASGRLTPPDVASALGACDMLLQPYPDGVTTRRTSVMAGLRNGVATLTTAGPLTEPVWRESGAAALVAPGDTAAIVSTVDRWLREPAVRAAQGSSGRAAYDDRFSMEHTVALLRRAG